MPNEKKSFRFDFKIESVNFDEKTDTFISIIVPHPERYELRTVNGGKCYFDKFDEVFIPIEEIDKMLKWMQNKQILSNPPKIKSGNAHIIGRMKYIKYYLDKQTENYSFSDKSEDFLSSLKKDKQRFVILSIDLKDSTELSQILSDELNAKIISLYIKEMIIIVDGFGGFVLKTDGDGLIAYFPEPNFIGMNDNAIDCAVTMKKMIVYAINPILKKRDLPELNFRIGLDSGEAIIKTLGVENIKIHKDLIGETVNKAAKIQKLANSKQILMGESTVLNIHTFWRSKINIFNLPNDWKYKNKETGELYPVYYLLESW